MEAAMQRQFLKKYRMETRIISYCKIKNNRIWVNGRPLLESAQEDLAGFLSEAYKKLELNYAKFFKMDKLCKLGLLATEVLIRDTENFEALPKETLALVFSNRASSLESDRAHAAMISDKKNYFPSPSVFVYTLPNIVTGEIAIKHKITGENAFFVSDTFHAGLHEVYGNILLNQKNTTSLIGGWVNVDGQSAEAFVYCVKNSNFKEEIKHFQQMHNSKNLEFLYSL